MAKITQERTIIPQWQSNNGKKVLIIATSPRQNGNSHLLGKAVAEGALESGHNAVIVTIAQHVHHMMKYCRECRLDNGECSLDDGFSTIFRNLYQPADAVVFATPIWWYGMTAHMKNFLDRIACEISASNEKGAQAKRDVMGKRMALLLSAEESNFACRMGIITQFNEFCRHLRCQFVGQITGLGNLRGEIAKDPLNPIAEARELGRQLFLIEETDYELDSERGFSVWPDNQTSLPSYWR